jgi:hypothetical protein
MTSKWVVGQFELPYFLCSGFAEGCRFLGFWHSCQRPSQPQSTLRTAPLRWSASPEARKRQMPAMSAGLPQRFSGTRSKTDRLRPASSRKPVYFPWRCSRVCSSHQARRWPHDQPKARIVNFKGTVFCEYTGGRTIQSRWDLFVGPQLDWTNQRIVPAKDVSNCASFT